MSVKVHVALRLWAGYADAETRAEWCEDTIVVGHVVTSRSGCRQASPART